MKFPSKEIVERVRRQYPAGCRVELVRMDDVAAPPIGTKGAVYGVDDTASVLVHWYNGCGLNVVYGEDECRKICPRFGKPCNGVPALSRADNTTLICPDCGTRQTLDSIGMESDKQEEILKAICYLLVFHWNTSRLPLEHHWYATRMPLAYHSYASGNVCVCSKKGRPPGHLAGGPAKNVF